MRDPATRHDSALLDRRAFLLAGSLLVLPGMGAAAARAKTVALGPETPFSFEGLVAEAKALAAAPYVRPKDVDKKVLGAIDAAAWRQAEAQEPRAWPAGKSPGYVVAPFPLADAYRAATRIYVVSGRGKAARARELTYAADAFALPKDSSLVALPPQAGFAGFQIRAPARRERGGTVAARDWIAFSGDGRLRAIGTGGVYGAWAEALRTGDSEDNLVRHGRFTRFYLEPLASRDAPIVVDALFDGSDVAGAYRFALRRGKTTTVAVQARLFVRADLKAMVLAPLRSMYWFSETVKNTALDWHPEVHDSDGLAIAGGDAGYLWRALCNPAHTQLSTYPGAQPQGWGLCQRDRDFNHYLSHAFYERRPTVWLQPEGAWPKGEVELAEQPIDRPENRNITAQWRLTDVPRKGDALRLGYQLLWGMDEPEAHVQRARCVATRMGLADPGVPDRRAVRRFVVAFVGGPLTKLPLSATLDVQATATNGTVANAHAEPVPNDVRGHWRALFDLTPAGTDACDLRLVLRRGRDAVSETWAYRYLPV